MKEIATDVGIYFMLGLQAILSLTVFFDLWSSSEPLWAKVLITMVVNFLNQQTFRFLKGAEE